MYAAENLSIFSINREFNIMQVLFLVVMIVFLIVMGPIVMIWSLNTLFALGIEYTFFTWAAALFLGSLIGARSK
jgi:hypothetical protein